MRTFVLVSAGLLVALGCLGAGTDVVPPSNAAFARLEQIRSAAASGEPAAQFKMGDYYYARGDFTNAVNWYALAAEQEHREAQLSLATCYLFGRGVDKDTEKASAWADRARGALVVAKAKLNTEPLIPIPNPAPIAVSPSEPAKEAEPSVPRVERHLEKAVPELAEVRLTLQRYGYDEDELPARLKP